MTLADREWLSSKQAAARLGVTPRTLYRLIDLGQLPAYRIGRVIRLQCGEVEDYIATCRVVPGTLGHLHNFPTQPEPDDDEPPPDGDGPSPPSEGS